MRLAGLGWAGLLCVVLGAPAAAGEPPAAGTRRIRVVDEAGKPLAAARLAPAAPGPDGTFVVDPAGAPGTEATSDGEVDVPAAPPEGGGAWAVWAPGFAARRVGTDATSPLALPEGGRVSGAVRWSNGKPAGGVALLIEPLGEREAVVSLRLVTDKAGKYRTDSLAGRTWRISMLRADGRWTLLRTAGAGQLAVDAVAAVPGGVAGRLIDGRASGTVGVPGIALRFVPLPRGREGASPAETKTGPDGRFVVLDVPAGVYDLELLDPEWMFDQPVARIEVAGEGTVHQASWFVARRVSLVGSVVGRESKPVVNARVHLVPDPRETPTPANPSGAPEPVATDLQGRFRFVRLVPGDGWRLLVTAPGFAPLVSPAFEIESSGETRLNAVTLDTGWALDVEVRDAAARPLEGVVVRAVAAEHPAAGTDPRLAAFVATAKTDPKGVAALTPLPEEDMWLTFQVPGHLAVAERVRRPATSGYLFHRVLLTASPTLEGSVSDATGRPAPGLRVRARACGPVPVADREVVTDPEGRFALKDLPPQAVDVDVLAAGGRSLLHVEGVMPGEERLDLALPALQALGGTVEGLRVAGPAPVVLLEARVKVPDEAEARWRVVESRALPRGVPAANFRFEGLSPGDYALRASQGPLDTEAQPVRLADATIDDLQLVLPESGSVAGAVVDGRGLPVLGSRVLLVRLRGDGEMVARPEGPLVTVTGDRGTYGFPDVAPGLWRVEAADVGAGVDVEVVRLLEAESLVVRDLSLVAGATLEGKVEDARGRAVDGARLLIRSLERDVEAREIRTGADGGYRAIGLAPGGYAVRCQDGPDARFSREATVILEDRAVTRLDFVAGGTGELMGTVMRGGHRAPGVTLIVERELEEGETLAVAERVLTDFAGAFSVDGLPAGRYHLTLEDGTARTGGDVVLEEGDRETVDLELWEGRLTGEVRRKDGTPEGDAEVVARPARTVAGVLEARARTDPNGRFTLVGVPVGRYDLIARGSGGLLGVARAAQADLPGADRPTTIVLAAGGSLEIEVRGTDGRPAAGARVSLRAVSQEEAVEVIVLVGPSGRVVVDGVPAGRVRLQAVARDAGRAFAWTEVTEGTTANVRLALTPAGMIRVVVRGASTDALRRAKVEVRAAGSADALITRGSFPRRKDWATGMTWVSNALEVRDLEPGDYDVVVDAGPRWNVGRALVRVRAADVTNAVLVLVPSER